MSEGLYDSEFYAIQQEQSLRSARKVLPAVFELVTVKSLVDVGCGVGTWLRAAKDLGVGDVLGFDGDYVARSALLIDGGEFHPQDLSKPLPATRRFDLAMSVEVAEHLPDSAASQFVKQLTALADVVLFSAAIPYQGGVNHVNERWPEYWSQLFVSHGFEPIDCIRDRFWSDADVGPWYAQNAVLYVAKARLSEDAKLKQASERAVLPLRRLVHPELYLRYARPENWSVRRALSQLRSSIKAAVAGSRDGSSS